VKDQISFETTLAPYSGKGRIFEGVKKVKLGDASPSKRLRLDSLITMAQDFSDEDTYNAGLKSSAMWVARSIMVEVGKHGELFEELSLKTFCSGLGSRWAERRISISGSLGACYEISTIWVCLDPNTRKPILLDNNFLDLYSEAASDRKIKASIRSKRPTDFDKTFLQNDKWVLRKSDFDVMSHVNNASYWTVIEDKCDVDKIELPMRAQVVYGGGVPISEYVHISSLNESDFGYLWWIVDQKVAASAEISQ